MSEHIDPHQQRLIVERLARSTDSLTSTERFNENFGTNLGESKMHVNDLARLMKSTPYKSHEVERAIRDITGHTVDLEKLD